MMNCIIQIAQEAKDEKLLSKLIGTRIRDNYILSSMPKASEEQATVNWPNVTVGNNQSQAYYLVQ